MRFDLGTSESRSIVDTVAERLRDGIRDGRYQPGQRLVEIDITTELGVSRGALREALGRLSSEGLVNLLHHRGARVSQLSRAQVMHLYNIREALESLAARLAARRVAEGAVNGEPIAQLVRDMDAALNDGSIGRYISCNQAFHNLLIEWSANDYLGSLVRQLQVPVFRLQFRAIAELSRLRAGNDDHRQIASAILAGDEDRAADAMQAHIRRTRADTEQLSDDHFAR